MTDKRRKYHCPICEATVRLIGKQPEARGRPPAVAGRHRRAVTVSVERTWLWFSVAGGLSHAFTPLLSRSACGGFVWGLQWAYGTAGGRCAGCIAATRGAAA